MPYFRVIPLEEVQGRIPIWLLVHVNDDGAEHCPFRAFEASIQSDAKMLGEFRTILKRIQSYSNLQRLPQEKFRQLDTIGSYKLYEFKSKHLRCYLTKNAYGHVVLEIGYKTNQSTDLRRLKLFLRSHPDNTFTAP